MKTEGGHMVQNDGPVELKYKELFGKVMKMKFYYISGKEVREKISIDFTQGGTNAVFSFIPPDEFWIERMSNPIEHIGILVHEWTEYLIMTRRGWNYDRSHNVANEFELLIRTLLNKNHK